MLSVVFSNALETMNRSDSILSSDSTVLSRRASSRRLAVGRRAGGQHPLVKHLDQVFQQICPGSFWIGE
jgi:hypothetical protein